MSKLLDTLRHTLKTCDVSRYQIARETGIPESALSRFVNGKVAPSGATLAKLADYFGFELVRRAPKRKAR